jgi:hypothetical protein
MSELAEGARLEIVCAVKSGTEGSNPSLSAILNQIEHQKGIFICPILYSRVNTAPKHLMRS